MFSRPFTNIANALMEESMPKEHVFEVNHGPHAGKQIAEEYHAFAIRAQLAHDARVTIEFREGELASENSEAINITESDLEEPVTQSGQAERNVEAINPKKAELEELLEQQIEVGMILRDTHGELYHVINEQEGPPKKYEMREDEGSPMLGTDELHFAVQWLTAEAILGEDRNLEIVGRHMPTCKLNGLDRHYALCNCTAGQLVQQASEMPPDKPRRNINEEINRSNGPNCRAQTPP
jgi:hypothetical protein